MEKDQALKSLLTQSTPTRTLRAEVFIKEYRKNADSAYGVACLKLAQKELEWALDESAPLPDDDVLAAFKTKTHSICPMVNDQCVLCGSTE